MSEFQNKKNQDWKKILDSEQYSIMREAGTEGPGSSKLNEEKRKGIYDCAECDKHHFESEKKYASGSGWPSFFACKPGALKSISDCHI